MATTSTTEVRLHFPNIDKTFTYTYPCDLSQNREEQAMREWYENEAQTLFALYGYGPMDVSVYDDGERVSVTKICYQEYLWHVFFDEGGDPWHGRFFHFTMSLMEIRAQYDREQLKAA